MKKNLLLVLVCGLFFSVNVNAKVVLKTSNATAINLVTTNEVTLDLSACEGEKCKKGDKCCKKKDSKASAKKSKCCSAEASANGKSCCMKKDKAEAAAEKKEETK